MQNVLINKVFLGVGYCPSDIAASMSKGNIFQTENQVEKAMEHRSLEMSNMP
jgi:hypothetical protein